MVLSALDERIFAIDRRATLIITINGQVIPSGLSAQGNIKAVDVAFDIEQIPPTASLVFSKEQLTDDASGIPSWVMRGMDVWIDAGYDGVVDRIFTGRVKNPRHGVSADTLECTGRTNKLTRPYRASASDDPDAKRFQAVEARAAILDILNDYGVDFTSAAGEVIDIDPILMNDGTPWIMGTPMEAVLDMAPPSDMIRKIADVYGHRMFELPSGTLRISDLLEVPAPTGFRSYTTDPDAEDTTVESTLTFGPGSIDAAALLGNVAANTRRSQSFVAGASGSPVSFGVWARRVGSPTDGLSLFIFRDDGTGLPSTDIDAVLTNGQFGFNGQLLDLVNYTPVTIPTWATAQLVSGTTYHLVIARTGALDAVNYYEIGVDSLQGYAGGVASVFDGTTWTAEAADIPFDVVTNSFAALRVLDIGDEVDEDQIKKKIIVRGAVYPSLENGDEVQAQITDSVSTDRDDIVAGDPNLFAMTYLNDLINTAQVAADVADRLLDKYHRVLQSIEVEVPFDPRMQLGVTITIDDPAVTGVTGNWYVHGYRHTLSAGSAVTQMSLFGGDQSGTTGEHPPQVAFIVNIERELIGNALMAIVTFTSTSTDRDGWITNYRWADNYVGGVNDVNGELTSVTFAYDSSVDPVVQMTLTVTDNDGRTASALRDIDVTTNNEEIYAPIVSCAAGNTCMATFDGGRSWQDIATPSGDARVTAITYNPAVPQEQVIVFFGTTTGRIYRSIDGMQTLVLEYTDSDGDAITDIKPDTDRRGVVWATTTDRVLLSLNYGDTWGIYTDFNNSANWPKHDAGHVNPGPTDPRPINALEVSNAEVNRIWIFGGTGDVVESWVATNYIPNGGAMWSSEISQGDGVGAAVRDALDTVVDFVTSHAYSGDLGLIFERTGGGVPTNPYIFASTFYPVGTAGWQVGGGAMVTPGVDGVAVAGNHLQDQQFGAWLDSTTFYIANDGRSFWPVPNALPGTGANRPHSLLSVSAWEGVYLTASDEGVAKSIDGGLTWAFFRPVGAPINTTWPGGAIGWDVAIEYRRPRSFNVAAIVRDASGSTENALAVRTQTGGWEDRGPLPTAHIDRPHRLWHFPQVSDQVFFFVRYTSGLRNHQEQLYRTPDGGENWVVAPPPLVICYAMNRSPDGTLWATGESHAAGTGHAHEIFRSTDNGLSWELIFSDPTESFGAFTMYEDIVVDPNDPNRVMAVGGMFSSVITLVSTNATAGLSSDWSRQVTGFVFEGQQSRYPTPFVLAGDSERWIIGFMPSGANRMRIYTNDNNGVPADWTLRHDVVTSGATFGFADRLRAGNILYAIGGHINDLEGSGGILRSVDNGQSWQTVATPGAVNAGIWDGQTDIFIAARNVTTSRLPYYQPPTPDAIGWPGVDDGLDTAMGYTAKPMTGGLQLVRNAPLTGSATELWAIAQVAAAGGDTDIWLREAASDSWRNYLDMPDTLAAENRFPIWHFPGMGDVMFRLKIGDLGSAASGYGGTLERSADRGANWTTVLTNVGALARGRNGDLWATRDDRGAPASFQPRAIYRSRAGDGNSVGLVWTLMGTDTTAGAGGVMTKYTQIRVDPNNANRIMAVGGLETDTMRSAYSSDGGLNWTFRSGSMSFRDGTAADGNFINLEAGGASRWIVGLSQANGLAKFIFVSDDFGQTWVQKYTVVTTAVTFGWADSVRAGGGNLYLAGNGGGDVHAVDGRVVVSPDNGDTWAPFTGDDRTSIVAVTYDNSQSALYIGRASAANDVLRMQNPSVLGVWQDDAIPSDPRFILQEGLEIAS